ncbi:MAG: MopE-related protein [Sandaracinaceae bacterium]
MAVGTGWIRSRLAHAGLALLVASAWGCANGSGNFDSGSGGGMDAARADAGSGDGGAPDAGDPPDAGPPIITEGGTCDPCNDTADCLPGHFCADIATGGSVCLPGCDPDIPSCPGRFDCVRNLTDELPDPVCAPVGERCCVDEDMDLYGTGVGCLGLDCDDGDDSTHADATELCDGIDNNCNGTADDGDPDTMCPRGAHVAMTSCASAACTITMCEPGFGDCDGDPSNGCERALNTVTDCGSCGVACAPANATGDCASGTCRIGTCDAGYGDCDADATNGCETSTRTTTDCGICGRACMPAGAVGDCSTGTCRIGSCDPHRGDCDANAANGCETVLTTNTDCGTCGSVCAPPSGLGECSTGMCRLTTCTTPGTADCDMLSSNGCETSIRTLGNCGGCGIPCARAHATATCASGTCSTLTCDAGWGSCDGNETNGCEQSLTTNTHCGGCGVGCAVANGVGDCSSGTCQVASCNPGYGNCDGIAANGCEQPLNTGTHCGGCGVGCSLAHASESCGSGTCSVTSCDSGYGNCDGTNPNGCERQLNTLTNCAGCGVSCSRPQGTVSCSTGTCTLTGCLANYSNCDGSATNGCEQSHAQVQGTCAAPLSLGSMDGDRSCGLVCGSNTAWDTSVGFSDRNSRWLSVRMVEDSDCPTDIEHRITLTSPAGTDYDLYVYRTCGGSPVASSTSTSTTDQVTLRVGDSPGSSDTFTYMIEVRYYSGESCTNWDLLVEGHNC